MLPAAGVGASISGSDRDDCAQGISKNGKPGITGFECGVDELIGLFFDAQGCIIGGCVAASWVVMPEEMKLVPQGMRDVCEIIVYGAARAVRQRKGARVVSIEVDHGADAKP